MLSYTNNHLGLPDVSGTGTSDSSRSATPSSAGSSDPSQDRRLARRYPDMRHQVGRACAAASYAALYAELGLLPDVSIAEEVRDARDTGAPDADAAGADDIYRSIVAQPVRYAVIDDYTRIVDSANPRPGARLNGDAAVRSGLFEDIRTLAPAEWAGGLGFFNITEEDIGLNPEFAGLPLEFASLLYEPLPADLPTPRKDTLIIMAAWEGSVDRFARLRRPTPAGVGECVAVVRGIRHSINFAKWWSVHDEMMERLGEYREKIRRAITARFIMSNDLSRIPLGSEDEDDVPDVIWHPQVPAENTLRELILRRPNAKVPVLLAAIAGRYWTTYDELISHVVREDLQRRAMESGVDIMFPDTTGEHPEVHLRSAWKPDLTRLPGEMDGSIYTHFGESSDWSDRYISEGIATEMARWQLYVCASDESRRRAKEQGHVDVYGEWDSPVAWKTSLPWNRREKRDAPNTTCPPVQTAFPPSGD